jgi:hypothetical protein
MNRRIRLAEPPPDLDTGTGISSSNRSIVNNRTVSDSFTSSTRQSVVGLNQQQQQQQLDVAMESMTFIHGRSFIVPNSELARAVVIRNSDETDKAITSVSGDYTSATPGRTSVPQPIQVSNLTMLLNQQLGIESNGIEIAAEESSAQQQQQQQRTEITNNNITIDDTSNYYSTGSQQMNINYGIHNNVSSSWQQQYNSQQYLSSTTAAVGCMNNNITPIDSGSSAEADSASGPPPMTPPAPPVILSMPRRSTATSIQTQPQRVGLGSSAPSNFNTQHRVVMFKGDTVNININTENDNVMKRNTVEIRNNTPSVTVFPSPPLQQEQKEESTLRSDAHKATVFSDRVRRYVCTNDHHLSCGFYTSIVLIGLFCLLLYL